MLEVQERAQGRKPFWSCWDMTASSSHLARCTSVTGSIRKGYRQRTRLFKKWGAETNLTFHLASQPRMLFQ